MEKRSLQNTNREHIVQAPSGPKTGLMEIFADEYIKPLYGESFEHATEALGSLEALQAFRRELADHPFASFYELVEAVTKIGQRADSADAKRGEINRVVNAMQDRAAHFSPRIADLFQALLATLAQEPYKPHFEETQKQMVNLTLEEGERSHLDVLFAKDVSWDLKLNRIKQVLGGYLAGMRALDKREGKYMDDEVRRRREEELQKAPTEPSPQGNESKPGVDPMERLKEGERAPAIWSILPAWGGLYKEGSFEIWDEASKRWKNDKLIYSDVPSIALSKNVDSKKGPIDITLTANIRTDTWYPVPSSYKHGFHTVEAQGKAWKVRQSQNGDLFLFVSGDGGSIGVEVVFAPDPFKKCTSKDAASIKVPNMPALFTHETKTALQKILTSHKGNMAKASAVRRYVTKRIQYLAPKDHEEAERYNSFYRTSSNGFAGAVDEVKKGDCDVVNTYFAALCAQLNIPVRHAVGHSVKGKDASGASVIHSGTGHGWSEIWDELKNEWIDVDSTPAGDPNLEESSEKNSSEPGYFGQQEAVCPKDELLEALRKKLAEHKEKLSYTREERELAEAGGVELKEARQIVKEIAVAEDTRLPSGRRVVDVLAGLFNAIVESRKVVREMYDGPVRKKEGGRQIQDIVRHKIGVVAGDSDPISREIVSNEDAIEPSFGGFDVYVIGDKSGSMGNAVDGEALWQTQRRAEYLVFSSLHRFERAIERAGISSGESLNVRTQGISFRGSGEEDIDLDKPLSMRFTPTDRVKLWHSLSSQGGGNGDIAALNYIYGQIQDELQQDKKGISKKRLRLVIACSDGGPDDPVKVREYAEALGKLGTLVVGIGLTGTALSVPHIYTTPFSRGDIVKDVKDLPLVIAKHLITEAIRLFPAQAKENAQALIDSVLAEFKPV